MADTNSKDKVETIFVEVYDRRDSGFIRDETEGTPFEERLNCPSKLNIPNVSFRRGTDGKTNERIRYIAGENEIVMSEQKRLGLEPNPSAKTDKIVIENGNMTVANEGSTMGLYQFLNECFWNHTNPKRSDKATPLFNVIDLNKIEEQNNELDMLQNEASAFVYGLQLKKGDVWVYQEQRIDALCTLFNVFAERYPSKINALVGLARLAPKEFLDKVKIFEQTAATMIAHALQLNVIKFEGNTAMYLIKDKVIKNLGAGALKQDEKIEQLSQFLRSSDGSELYHELTAEVENAKNKKD